MEIDLIKDFTDKMLLKHGNYKFIQSLDYENMNFTCWRYHQTRHLQETCPQLRSRPKKRKLQFFKSRNWQPYDPPLKDKEEESFGYFPTIEIEKVNQEKYKIKNNDIKQTIEIVQP